MSAQLHAGTRGRLPGADTPRGSACWEILATSRRYASYWNAYLLIDVLNLISLQDEKEQTLTTIGAMNLVGF